VPPQQSCGSERGGRFATPMRLVPQPFFFFSPSHFRSTLCGTAPRSQRKMLLLDTPTSRLMLPCWGFLIFPCANPAECFLISCCVFKRHYHSARQSHETIHIHIHAHAVFFFVSFSTPFFLAQANRLARFPPTSFSRKFLIGTGKFAIRTRASGLLLRDGPLR
jgi:hypothetical protein